MTVSPLVVDLHLRRLFHTHYCHLLTERKEKLVARYEREWCLFRGLMQIFIMRSLTQLTFNCSKSTTETLERVVRIPLLSMNELGEKSGATIRLGNFIITTWSNSYWLVVFGKCLSLVRILSTFTSYYFNEL